MADLMQQARELLPCPFCGEAVHLLVEHLDGTIIHPAYRVRCDYCGASSGYTDKSCAELWNARAALRAAPEGFVLVPVEPTVGLLMSMAIRRDHGLGCPGYYDDPAFGGAGWHQRRLDAALGYARQQHEEVVGHGFYSADREQQYASLAARPQEQGNG